MADNPALQKFAYNVELSVYYLTNEEILEQLLAPNPERVAEQVKLLQGRE